MPMAVHKRAAAGRPKSRSANRVKPSAAGRLEVLLAVLPFARISEPVIGVSILKAATEEAGFPAVVRYFNLDFAQQCGVEAYHHIESMFGSHSLVGDWVFAEALYGEQAPAANRFLDYLRADYSRLEDGIYYGARFNGGRNFTEYIEQDLWPELLRARQLACDCARRWADEILACAPRVVGFTSSALQACSCLAVARHLKQSARPPIVIFGGPNCHEELGHNWLRCFSWIDYVCNGEGDEVFPVFLRQVLRSEGSPPIAGILSRSGRRSLPPRPVADLDRTPIPDYSDYFQQRDKSSIAAEIPGGRRLPLETSRGCWWGEKLQCTFCGDNETGIAYRSKSPARVIREIAHLAATYQCGNFGGVDDAMDRKHIHTVFPNLAASKSKFHFNFQTRPELSRDDLETLVQGGVGMVQPGIESFSDTVLRLMRKGTTGLRNIQLLRTCQEVGMAVGWRILYGIPGEPVSEYERTANLVPLLTHMTPPLGAVAIQLKRFSPHWRNPDIYGLTDLRPSASYSCIYPFAAEQLNGIACHFGFEYGDGREPFQYSRSLRREVGEWIRAWQTNDGGHPRLDLRITGDEARITDTRSCAVRLTHRLTGLTAKLYVMCGTVQSENALLREFRTQSSDSAVRETIAQLVASKLLVEDNQRYLRLAVAPWPR